MAACDGIGLPSALPSLLATGSKALANRDKLILDALPLRAHTQVMTTYRITRNGHTVAKSTNYSEALRIANAYTRADRALHLVSRAPETGTNR